MPLALIIIIVTISVIACNTESDINMSRATNFELTDANGQTVALVDFRNSYEKTVLLFYRGHFWGICQRQLVELQNSYAKFKKQNIGLIAVSMDTVDEAAYTKLITKAEYPLLSDPTGLVIKAYGVYDLLGDGVATPSVFIIRSDGSISWSYIAKDIKDRPTTDEILNHIE